MGIVQIATILSVVVLIAIAFLLVKLSRRYIIMLQDRTQELITSSKDAMLLSELPINTLLAGKYRLLQKIADSETTLTYLAEDRDGRRFMVITPVPRLTRDQNFVSRFVKEMDTLKSLSRLKRAGIPQVHDSGVMKERGVYVYYLVLEYFEGRLLSDIIETQAPFPPDTVIQVLKDLSEALNTSHSFKVIHNNISPGSIWMGGDGHAWLINYSIAPAAESLRSTQTSRITEAAQYIAPDVLGGQKPSFQSDLYALGVLAFRMLTGHFPFEENNFAELVVRKTKDHPPRALSFNKDIPPVLDDFIDRLISPYYLNRFISAKELNAELLRNFRK